MHVVQHAKLETAYLELSEDEGGALGELSEVHDSGSVSNPFPLFPSPLRIFALLIWLCPISRSDDSVCRGDSITITNRALSMYAALGDPAFPTADKHHRDAYRRCTGAPSSVRLSQCRRNSARSNTGSPQRSNVRRTAADDASGGSVRCAWLAFLSGRRRGGSDFALVFDYSVFLTLQ